MRFTQTIFALAALTSYVFAQETTPGFDAISNPSYDYQEIAAGSDFEITWTPQIIKDDSETVTISILAGDSPGTLQPGAIVGTVANKAGKYSWKAVSTGAKTYGFKIALDSAPSTFQYSHPFVVTGGSSSSSSASASSTASASASASSSSSSSASVVTEERSPSTYTTTSASASITALGSANITNVKTESITSTVCTKCAGSNSTAIASSTFATLGPSSNVTLATTLSPTKTSAAGGGASATTSASTSSATASGNAAAANMAQKGFALVGGLVLAFAL